MSQAQQSSAWDQIWPVLSGQAHSLVAITEHDAIRKALGNCAGLTILDLGCGLGQPVATFAQARRLVALDSSIEALARCRAPQSRELVKILATALHLPFADAVFDVVVAAQLLPHLDHEQRTTALAQIARVVKPGGKIILTALHYNFRFPRLGMAKSGVSDGVYFFRHTADELRQELQSFFQIQTVWGVWNYLPKTYQLFMRLGRKTLYWDRIVRKTPLSLHYGKQLVVRCRIRA